MISLKKERAIIFTQALKIAIENTTEAGRKYLKKLPDSEYYESLKIYEKITKSI